MSSVLCTLNELASKPGFQEAVTAYLQQDIFFVALSSTKLEGQLVKQLAVMCADKPTCIKASDFLAAHMDGHLQLEFIDEVEHEGFICRNFHQKNTIASRKQAAPACLQFLDNMDVDREGDA